jgi:hypothetical protein
MQGPGLINSSHTMPSLRVCGNHGSIWVGGSRPKHPPMQLQGRPLPLFAFQHPMVRSELVSSKPMLSRSSWVGGSWAVYAIRKAKTPHTAGCKHHGSRGFHAALQVLCNTWQISSRARVATTCDVATRRGLSRIISVLQKGFLYSESQKSSLWQYFRPVDTGLRALLAKDFSHCCVALFATFLYTHFLLSQSQV